MGSHMDDMRRILAKHGCIRAGSDDAELGPQFVSADIPDFKDADCTKPNLLQQGGDTSARDLIPVRNNIKLEIHFPEALEGWSLDFSSCLFVYEGLSSLSSVPTAKSSTNKPTVLRLEKPKVSVSAEDYGTKSRGVAPLSVQLNSEAVMDVFVCMKSAPPKKGQHNKFYPVLEFNGSCQMTATAAKIFVVSSKAYFVGHHKRSDGPARADESSDDVAATESSSSGMEASTVAATAEHAMESFAGLQHPPEAVSLVNCNATPLPRQLSDALLGTDTTKESFAFQSQFLSVASPFETYSPRAISALLVPPSMDAQDAEYNLVSENFLACTPAHPAAEDDPPVLDPYERPMPLFHRSLSPSFEDYLRSSGMPLPQATPLRSPSAGVIGDKRRRSPASSPRPSAKRARSMNDDSDDQSEFRVLLHDYTQ